MIYLTDLGAPPHSGIRLGHEMVTENVIEVKVQYAPQSFRGGRRELTLLDVIGDRDATDDPALLREIQDCSANLSGRRPLVSSRGGDR